VVGLCLLALVLTNSCIVAFLDKSDLGWSEGYYTLALPTVAYAIICVADFYALRKRCRATG
jgi:hypothetical protein